MHISTVHVHNIRSISQVTWNLGARPGWNVIIGDNGSGKSAFLRAISLALVGKENAEALRQDWSTWLRFGETDGSVRLDFDYTTADDKWAKRGRKLENYLCYVRLKLTRETTKVDLTYPKVDPSTSRHIFSGKPGWFSAAFGPFRRFTGGDIAGEKFFYTHPQLARHLSVFGENVSFSECIRWLQQLRFRQLEGHPEGALLEQLPAFINQGGFLPHGVRLESISSEEVRFTDANGFALPVTSLSDGFRSALSFTFELLHQLSISFGAKDLFSETQATTIVNGASAIRNQIVVDRSGVVLVDEIDAHLHPTWQRRIGFWLTEHFPKIQFIVTTHSPLVCHAAEKGSILRLPTPGTEQESAVPEGIERERLIFGSVLDAYGTELFGSDISRSYSSQKKQTRLAELNQQALFGKLTANEQREREQLQALFPSLL